MGALREQATLEAGERSIRVFVSSTFRDMQLEREGLAKHVFPELRRRCATRGVTWGEVDLRWGITDEQKEQGKVLPYCLAEIERCRPYFIGLLGERYGWVPSELSPELVERQGWIEAYRGRSVTELEIVHGVLQDPDMACHAFFYLRDPAYVDDRPADEQPLLREVPTADEVAAFGAGEAERRAGERREELRDLKARIRASGFPVRDYGDPRGLRALVSADLTRVIDRLFPEGSEPDPLTREAAEHDAYAASRAMVYVGHGDDLSRLDAHAGGDGPPIVVVGESGVGKSALLANWARAFRRSHPDIPMIMHFVGSSPYSSDWRTMLRRITAELSRHLEIDGPIPDAPEQLRLAFAQRLHAAAARGRVVLVIDALEQLEDRDGAPDLMWLPPVVPATVRLILSTLPGRGLEALAKRGWPRLMVKPLAPEERTTLIVEYLRRYTKELSPDLVGRIAASPQTANPLYLRALLEELRLWGAHETLRQRIDHYLAARTIPALYERILARYETDYEEDRPGLVRDAMSLVWAARRGLSEAELLDLLGPEGERLSAADWAPLSLAADQSLANHSGLIGFSHVYFRRAVADRYLSRPSDRSVAHLRLADYFETRRADPRGVDELPWQLAEAESWTRLYDLLADLDFAPRALVANEFDVKACWAEIEGHSALRLVDAYRPLIDHPDRDDAAALAISKLLIDTGNRQQARALLARRLDMSVQGDLANLFEEGWLVNLAVTLQADGQLDKAMALFHEAERLSRARDDLVGLHRSLGNQATILLVQGKIDDATSLLIDQEQLCRATGDRVGLANSLGNQALVRRRQGQLDTAIALHEEEERLCLEVGDRAGLHRSLANQAAILQVRGEPDSALARYRDWERSCRELGDRAGLQAALGNQATVLVMRGELDGGATLLREQERICRDLGDLDGLRRSLGNQAVVLQRQGALDEAFRLQQEAAHICRGLDDRAGLQVAIGNMGQILQAQRQSEAAMALLQEQERICRELGDQEGLQDSLGNQGAIMLNLGDLAGAMVLFQEQERICRGLGHRAGIATALGNQAEVHRQRGEPGPALELLGQAERTFRELGEVLELSKVLVLKGVLLSDSGQESQAIACVQDAHRIAEQHGLIHQADAVERLLADR